jgi:hypothetical protein
MNCVLQRKNYGLYGITGTLSDDSGNEIAVTLEHSFPQPDGSFVPKVAPAIYSCARGIHRLTNLHAFETFEIENVPSFQGQPVSGILFHQGNYNKDSEGCVLLGISLGVGCILDSIPAFERFMKLQEGIESFLLTILA